jgi:hypothetical protein
VNYLAWALAGLLVLSAAISVMDVNKPRKPMTPGVLLVVLILDAIVIYVLIWAALR